MKRIAVINQKGGVGKTTTTVNLGAALAHHGKRALLLDLDPQANMTVHVNKRPDMESNTLTNLLIDETPLNELIQTTGLPNLFVVPSDTSLAGVEQMLANRIGRETILRQALTNAKAEDQFDFVLFDCPPSLGVLSANALVAADYVVIPMQAEYLSLQGMAKLLEIIELVKSQLNPDLEIACVLPCMLDSRTNLSTEVLNEIEAHFGSLLTKARIRNNVKLAEAPSFGRSIFEHAPDSNGAKDYAAFALEFMSRIGVSPNAEEPVAETEEPTVEAPVAEAEEPTAEEHVAEAEEPAVEEHVAETEEPTAEEPVAEIEEPTAKADVDEEPSLAEDVESFLGGSDAPIDDPESAPHPDEPPGTVEAELGA